MEAMLSPPTETAGLSKMDIRAIRESDRVIFAHSGPRNAHDGTIRLVKELPNHGPFEPSQRDYELTGLTSRVHDYIEPGETRPDKYSCFASISSSTFSDSVWHSIAAFVKIGDTLRLRWCADGNTHTKQHGLHLDSLMLIVERVKQGKGVDSFPFLIDTTVCVNNTARMIRPR